MVAGQIIVVVMILFVAFMFLIVFAGFFVFFRPWMRAFMSGAPIPFVQLIAMKLRRSNINLIIEQGISAAQAGHPISWSNLERAHLQKIDLEKITQAYITARKRDESFSFQELVDAEQATRTSV